MRAVLMFALTALLTACTLSEAPAPTVTPTPGLVGRVDITYPVDGVTVYAEAIYVQGIAESVDSFAIEVVGADDTIIARSITDGNEWTLELPHNYTGEPMEVTIYALPVENDLSTELIYDAVSIILSASQYRPQGVFGSITSPVPNNSVGGEMIQVTGFASGLFEGTLLVGLYDDSGTQVSMTVLTVFNPYYMDLVPWTAEIPTNGYLGNGEIRAFYQEPRDGTERVIASVPVTVTEAAG